jgi:hypothetical protein
MYQIVDAGQYDSHIYIGHIGYFEIAQERGGGWYTGYFTRVYPVPEPGERTRIGFARVQLEIIEDIPGVPIESTNS